MHVMRVYRTDAFSRAAQVPLQRVLAVTLARAGWRTPGPSPACTGWSNTSSPTCHMTLGSPTWVVPPGHAHLDFCTLTRPLQLHSSTRPTPPHPVRKQRACQQPLQGTPDHPRGGTASEGCVKKLGFVIVPHPGPHRRTTAALRPATAINSCAICSSIYTTSYEVLSRATTPPTQAAAALSHALLCTHAEHAKLPALAHSFAWNSPGDTRRHTEASCTAAIIGISASPSARCPRNA